MIKNTAFLAVLTLFLLVGWFAGELRFLAPYKRVLFHEHWPVIVAAILLVFLHLCAAYYAVARWLFVRDAGRKLTVVDRQLTGANAVLAELGDQLDEGDADVA
jgi:hypothetical protein